MPRSTCAFIRGFVAAAVACGASSASASTFPSDDAVAVWQHRDKSTQGWDVFYSVLEVSSFAGLSWHAGPGQVIAPVSTLMGDDTNPAVAFAPAGGALAVWEHSTAIPTNGTDIWFAAFDGTSWTLAAAVETIPGDDSDPAIAFDSDGQAIAVWVHDELGQRVLYASIWNGSAFSPASPINPVPGAWPGEASIPEVSFSARPASGGGSTPHRAMAVWSDLDNGAGEVRVFASEWDGFQWSALATVPVSGLQAFEVAADPYSRLGLTSDADGNSIVTWGGSATASLISSPGIAGSSFDGSSFTPLTTLPGDPLLALDRAHSPAVSTDGVGGLVAAYTLDGFLEWNSTLGAAFTPEDILGDTAGVDTRIALAPIRSGVLAVWWSEGGSFPPSEIYYATYDPFTRLWTAPAVLDTPGGAAGDDQNPSVSSFLSTVGPRLARVSPRHGPEAGSTFVTLSGYQLASGGPPTIQFGPNTATNVIVIDDRTVVCRTPPGFGIVSVTIANSNGAHTLADSFLYDEQPTIQAIQPAYGSEAGGTGVAITGFAFLDRRRQVSVTIGGAPATNVVLVDDGIITCTTPAGAEGFADVVVSNGNGMGTLSGGFRYVGPHVLCRTGNVNAGAGPIGPTLFINGSSGAEPDRVVTVGLGQPLTIAMGEPASRIGLQSRFCVYAYRRLPMRSNVTPQIRGPIDIGVACFPTPFSGGAPLPDKIFNNLHHEPVLGVPDFPSTPAPSVLFNRQSGVPHAVNASLFGFIRDNAASNPHGASITNLVILQIQ